MISIMASHRAMQREAGRMNENTQVVTFQSSGSLFAVPVNRVRQILDTQPIAPLPNSPAELLGLIDVRGESIAVTDLSELLSRGPTEDTSETRILILSLVNGQHGATVGLKTERVIEVTELDAGGIKSPADAGITTWDENVLTGIGRRNGTFVCILNLEKLFSEGVRRKTPEFASQRAIETSEEFTLT
ncbi:MAG: chemotaxis protein CheW [Roseovarius sp.]|jgi:purine-binding chemotaxis protein CheW|nr:chemotaxis protein CheW [Roseovarius sp.]